MMLKNSHVFAIIFALISFGSLFTAAQKRRDPLTDDEIDQLREQAQNPEDRLKLWVKFTQVRIAAMDQLRGDPKLAADRPQRIHNVLQDLGDMVDEIDDNMGMYAKDRWDIRKELKEIVELSSELQVKLRGLKDATDSQSANEARTYRFVLQDTSEAVNNLADDARDLLDQQNEQAKEKDPAKKLRKVQK
jgi:uncharacterized coiled-coil DUF342 family protein